MPQKTPHPDAHLASMTAALRVLCADVVEHAKSGHPGLPLGAADVVCILFTEFLKFDPLQPAWPDRDRFVLSAGHGSALLYCVLHLLGEPKLSLQHLKSFRKLHSPAAGHPESSLLHAVEATTGPLGQGFANAVGMALAERKLNSQFGDDLVNHRTFVLASDGDLMEGVSHEALSIAAHLNLQKLVVLHDDNQISIDGPLSLADSSNQVARFQAAGWNAQSIDGHNHSEIRTALENSQNSNAPSFISCKTLIGKFAGNKENHQSSHGSPLGDDALLALRQNLGLTDAPPFHVPEDALDYWRLAGRRCVPIHKKWEKTLQNSEPDKQREFLRLISDDHNPKLQHAMSEKIIAFAKRHEPVSTRVASANALSDAMVAAPEILPGSADLSTSCLPFKKPPEPLSKSNYNGSFIHYGVREHAMSAVMNGMALHKGVLPVGATFLTFSDYSKPAVRLAALSNLRVVFVFTHDSFLLGEDGPTHQPIEHLASLRALPNLHVHRPADALETTACWLLALQRTDGPSALVLSRQNLDPIEHLSFNNPSLSLPQTLIQDCSLGAYEISPADDNPVATIIATGSETSLAVKAQDVLAKHHIHVRVVSAPCIDLLLSQDRKTQNSILGRIPRISVEAASSIGWNRIVGRDGLVIGLDQFGASAPAHDLAEYFQFTPEHIARRVHDHLHSHKLAPPPPEAEAK